jgi:hypothetical protein
MQVNRQKMPIRTIALGIPGSLQIKTSKKTIDRNSAYGCVSDAVYKIGTK